MPVLTRRRLMLAGLAMGLPASVGWANSGQTKGQAHGLPPIHVVKGTGCECCTAWADHLKAAGFVVTEEERLGAALIRFKMDQGIPTAAYSCHTGMVDGYALEGHVPAADIQRLLAERPDAIGLAVPGMPYGSPGMGDETEREAYEVFLIDHDGASTTFSRYEAASG